MQDSGTGVVILDEIWRIAIEEAFENIYSNPTARDFAQDVAVEVAERVGIQVTDDLVIASMQRISAPAVAARLNAVGIIVDALIAHQQPNGLICNDWEYQLGQCHPVWDNPETYSPLVPLTSQGWDLGDSCLALPMTLAPIPQIQTQPGTQTNSEVRRTANTIEPKDRKRPRQEPDYFRRLNAAEALASVVEQRLTYTGHPNPGPGTQKWITRFGSRYNIRGRGASIYEWTIEVWVNNAYRFANIWSNAQFPPDVNEDAGDQVIRGRTRYIFKPLTEPDNVGMIPGHQSIARFNDNVIYIRATK